MGSKISDLWLSEVPLSSGRPTLAVSVQTSSGIIEWDASPVGTTIGELEPPHITVQEAKSLLPRLRSMLLGNSVRAQTRLDQLISDFIHSVDSVRGTGANLAAAVSCAIARAGATDAKKPLYLYIASLYDQKPATPRVMCNVLGGGGHHENDMFATELMLISSPTTPLPIFDILDIRSQIKARLSSLGIPMKTGLEGCLVPQGVTDDQALSLVADILLEPKDENQLSLGLDFAGFDVGLGTIGDLIAKYPLVTYLEDPFPLDRLDDYVDLGRSSIELLIGGDDLIVCDVNRIAQMARRQIINAAVLKLTHAGTLTELQRAAQAAKTVHLRTVCSQRSQETARDTLAHIAVGLAFDYIKAGCPVRERVANYAALLSLEDQPIA